MMKNFPNPLDDIFKLIEQGEFQKNIDINLGGKKTTFTFRSLYDEDYTWRDRYVSIDSQVAMAASLRAPTLAIATVAIDGVPVDEMPELTEGIDTAPELARDFVNKNRKFIVAYNLLTKIYQKLPRNVIMELYDKYSEEVEKKTFITSTDVKNS